jgi:methyl-accepting chemotaxis protein
MLKHSIAKKLLVVVVMVVVVASLGGVTGALSIWSLGSQFRAYEDMAGDALLASELNADMAKVLSNARAHILTRSPDSRDATRQFVAETRDGIAKAQKELHAPDRVALIGKIAEAFIDFERGLERVIALLARRDGIVNETLDVIGPQVRQNLTKIIKSNTASKDYETAALAGVIQEDLLTARLYVAKYLLNGRRDEADRVVAEFGELDKQLDRLALPLDRAEQQNSRASFMTAKAGLGQYRKAFVELREIVEELDVLRTIVLAGQGEAISRWAAEIKNSAVRSEDVLARELTAKVNRDEIIIILAAAIAFIFGGVVAIRCAQSIVTRPLMSMVGQMRALASGDATIKLRGIDRQDEIGEMARAVAVFRDNAVERSRLQGEQTAQITARAVRQEKLEKLIREFEQTSQQLLSVVGDNSVQMDLMSQLLTEVASNTVDNISAAAEGSAQASTSVEAAVAAADGLSQSIEEIGTQAQKTADVVARATAVASATNEKVARLSDSAREVGSVANVIREVAEQTNLLALNATIEAARAGAAGRGFAVVASEVKALASQTESATDLISRQIKAVQNATVEVVDAISEISRIMSNADSYAISIAAVVQEQTAASSSISDSVQRAAAGARHASSNLKQISGSAAETSRSVDQVMKASQEVATRTKELGDRINAFLKAVAAA